MPLADFLGRIATPQQPGPVGGFAGGTFGFDGQQMTDNLAMKHLLGNPAQAQQPQPQAQQQRPQRKSGRGGVRNFLGQLGDALLIGAGADPIHGPAQERAQLGEQLSQYLGAIDPMLAEIVRDNPEAGMALFNALREDKRFDRTHGLDERRVGIADRQADLGERELAERARANQAGEQITARGQDISSTTQVRLQQMRQQEAAAGRAHAAALKAGDRQHAERMLGLQQQFQREIKALEGGGPNGYTETTVTTPGSDAVDGWFTDTPATPSTKTVTRTPNAPAASAAPSQADLEFTAKKHGITVAEVKRRLGIN